MIFFIKIFLAHIIGDFLLQPESWVLDKKSKKITSKYLYLHMLVHAVALMIILQFQHWLLILLIVVSHFIIDILKLYLFNGKNKALLWFTVDQILHVMILGIATYLYEPFPIDINILYNGQIILLVTCTVMVSSVSSIIIKNIISPWNNELEEDNKSLSGAGKYIGIIERLLVFMFFILNSWTAIGFLMTAKSVFRFGDISEAKNRKLTEYVLIGTLLSFGLAILTGITYEYLSKLI